MDWQPIAAAQFVRLGTWAYLKMESGRVYRAVWEQRGRVGAWWPEDSRRRKPIALYEPVLFRVAAAGIGEGSVRAWERLLAEDAGSRPAATPAPGQG